MDLGAVLVGVAATITIGVVGWGCRKFFDVLVDIRDKVTVLVVKVDGHDKRISELEEAVSKLKEQA